MSVRQKDVSAADEIRGRAAALYVDGAACLRGITRAEKRAFARRKQQIIGEERTSPVAELWRKCLREMEIHMDQPKCRERLPAHDGRARVDFLAEWIWDAERISLKADELAAQVVAAAQAMDLTYAEIWLLPLAIRLHSVRCCLTATRMLAERNDEEAAHDILRRAQHIHLLLEDVPWDQCLPQMSPAEQLLLKDPGGVYPRMAEGSRQQARRNVQQIARRGAISERETAQAALKLCGKRVFPDVTQVLLTDRGIDMLQSMLEIPRWQRMRVHFDPDGRWIISVSVALTLLQFLLFAAFSGRFGIAILGLPVFWKIARAVFNRIVMALVPAMPLPRMEANQIPEDIRILVVIPARISDESELNIRLDELEACGTLERGNAFEYLLLADLPEAEQAHMPEDDMLMERAQQRIDGMNSGQYRFHVLWRERSLNEHDGIWQPKERKRGALMALYALLSGESSEFLPHSEASHLRKGDFRYVITMDAATLPYPGSFRQLAGTMMWPGNRFAIIQPCMRNAMRMFPTSFDRMIGPDAGTGPYSSAAGDLYQSLTGRGIFGGKGIVDIAAFRLALENRLPDNAVLSHDLIEGAIAGAGFAGDIVWLEYAPATQRGSLSRFERWTRGDWQLMPFLLDPDQPLDSLCRFQMTDNLLHPLAWISALLMLIGAAWTGSLLSAIVPLAALSLPLLLNLAHADSWRMRGCLADLCLLPARAFTAAAAAARALYRTYVSHKHMLEWTPAEVAEGTDGVSRIPGAVCAVLLVPALTHPAIGAAMFAVAGLFLLGADWVRVQQQVQQDAGISSEDRLFLQELAARTWRFFEDHVTAHTHFLPPDNVQADIATGPVMRTSPTNIGMYLLSCLCACRLGLINRETLIQRISHTLDTVERMPKWRGHLLNWNDLTTLQPVSPVVASSVDSGNFVGCLLCLSAADIPEELRSRARKLAEETDFAALYDAAKGLFHITADAQTRERSAAHYDLFASESRILSLAAIALQQVPALHWSRLGRRSAQVEGGLAYTSWSGTLFEYLMPDLLFAAPEQSAWVQSAETVTNLQIARSIGGLWGVSESGHSERDGKGYYQYRAFGLDEVCASGYASGGVIAPYAAALALKYRRDEAIDDLKRMAEEGYMTEHGLIEAIDFRMGEPQAVKSHMAHHQGMLLCAVTNALCGNYLCGLMDRLPEARAISPLLHETMAERNR